MKQKNMQWPTRLFLLLLCLILLAPAAAFEVEAARIPSYYGREALATMPNGALMIAVYDRLARGVESAAEEITVSDERNPLSVSEMETVMDAYIRDYAHHFWLGKEYTLWGWEECVFSIEPTYLMTGSALTKAKADFEREVNGLLEGITPQMSQFEAELYLHDALAKRITYTFTEHCYDAYGALVEGRAVCEGYAEALQTLLHRAGIRSFLALGKGLSGGKAIAHEWNFVEIGGAWYQVDLTWDDQGELLYHAYFNVTDSLISSDHALYKRSYPLPVCTATEAFYFTGKEAVLTSYSVEKVAQLLRNNNLQAHLYLTEDPDGFVSWLKMSINQIAVHAGLSGNFSYNAPLLGREVVLTLSPLCTHSDLSFVAAVEADCTEGGKRAHWACSCGMLFEDKEGKSIIIGADALKIPPLGHDFILQRETPPYLKAKAEDCTQRDQYWYACARCAVSAGDCPDADPLFFVSENAGDHSYAAVCDAACDLCGHIRTASEHRYDNPCDTACNTCGETRQVEGHLYLSSCDESCELCGALRRPAEAHYFDTPCDGVCNLCGYLRAAQMHKYDNACDAACNNCGEIREVEDHKYDHGCDKDCNVCGEIREVNDHQYDNGCDKDCNVCGAVREANDHAYDNRQDATCNNCGEVRPIYDGWVQFGEDWAFYKEGEMLKDQWMADSAGWCYLGEDGLMMKNAWIPDSQGLCRVDGSGYMVYNSWIHDGIQWRFVDAKGYVLCNAWQLDSQGWCYVGEDGYMLADTWHYDSQGLCYIGEAGYCEINTWKEYEGKKLYLDGNGSQVKNTWMQDDTDWLYLGADGFALTNQWMNDSAGWCYLGEDGYMVRNAWIPDSAGLCRVNGDGYLVTSAWIDDGIGWRYVDGNGHVLCNAWQLDSQGWCYVGEDGYMLADTWHTDSQGLCYIGEAGYCLTNTFKEHENGWVYLDANGSQVKNNWVLIGSDWYYLNAEGFRVENTTVNISGTNYTFDANGIWIA